MIPIKTELEPVRKTAAGRIRCIALAVAAASAMMIAPAMGARPNHWTHTTEADFHTGKFEHVVATNLGDLKLARDVKIILDQDSSVSAVYCLAEGPDGSVYAGTGPQGVLLRIKAEKVETVLKLTDDTSISSLAFDAKGRLLIGTVGQAGRILALENPAAATEQTKPVEIFADKAIQYIWSILITPDGLIYAATGPTGKIIEIKPDGSSRTLIETGEQNIVSLIAGDADTLYAGTDPHGLVYRINRKTGQGFVLYDAGQSEITALALDAKGNLFVAASEAAGEPGDTEPSAEPAHGRPESPTSGQPVPGKTPDQPTPPAMPEPKPGEPAPVPRNQEHTTPVAPKPAADKASSQEIPAASAPKAADSSAKIDGKSASVEVVEESPVMAELHHRLDKTQAQPEAIDVAGGPNTMETDDPESMPEASAPDGGFTGGSTDGNAVYRIDANGFVTEVFRKPAMILSLIEQDGSLLVGTGGEEGNIYQIQPGSEETILLAKVDPKQVTSLLPVKDGRIILGLANNGALATMSAGYATEGSFTSPVLDATQVSQFGNLHLTGRLPDKTQLLVQTRSGNVQEADDKTWSAWSDPVTAQQFLPVTSPSARFLQYRLVLKSTDPLQTPVVDDVDVPYQLPNIGPKVTAITVASAGGNEEPPHPDAKPATPAASPNKQIAWEAADASGATLQFTIYARTDAGGPWIKLKDKLSEPQWLWNTRLVADGQYYLRIEASNAADSPDGQAKTASRVSESIVVDNTPPVMGDLVWQKIPGGVKVVAKAADRSGTVAGIHYCVDSADDWQAIPSSDKMYDSPSERVAFELHDLSPGQHHLAIRATDNQGNQSYENLLVTVEQPAK